MHSFKSKFKIRGANRSSRVLQLSCCLGIQLPVVLHLILSYFWLFLFAIVVLCWYFQIFKTRQFGISHILPSPNYEQTLSFPQSPHHSSIVATNEPTLSLL